MRASGQQLVRTGNMRRRHSKIKRPKCKTHLAVTHSKYSLWPTKIPPSPQSSTTQTAIKPCPSCSAYHICPVCPSCPACPIKICPIAMSTATSILIPMNLQITMIVTGSVRHAKFVKSVLTSIGFGRTEEEDREWLGCFTKFERYSQAARC